MTTLIFPEVNDLYFQLFVNLMGIVYVVYGVGMIKKVSHSIQFHLYIAESQQELPECKIPF